MCLARHATLPHADITFLGEGNLSAETGWKYSVTITDVSQAARGNVNYPGLNCLRLNINLFHTQEFD